ncbi:TraM recognition domain-containing protein [Bacillus sp. Xin]|uniref:type IV secretory system conjugative DNA transfer family protein n=1 Tax=Bacillus sp. Xin TaxID=2766700 RepID=UPI00165310FD|nr:type IV secretory system conjugative DNA transfer family protein [Bacillus sp. Xin]MBC6973965.1 TraM recognition domain-containing protein [Bacillus sp. Xin]
MLGVIQRCSGLLQTVKGWNQEEKGVDVTKAPQEAYRTVIEGVRKAKQKYIFIFDPTSQFFEDTHQQKQKQGYQVVQHDLLSGTDSLQLEHYQKVVIYIHVNTMISTYEDRGEALSHFLHFLTEKKKIRPIHLVFYQLNLYPIPHMEQFLKESAAYNIRTSIVVESHSVLQRIYGKHGAKRIATSCQTTVLA